MEEDHAGDFGLGGVVIGGKVNLHLAGFAGGGFVDVGFACGGIGADALGGFGFRLGFGFCFSGGVSGLGENAEETEEQGETLHGGWVNARVCVHLPLMALFL